ncbi:MAG TPA: hypothetical protein VE733_00410 [Streptosporangiaceae bacterium]|jgi:hypothetical protein|nr:hypothetical protein [Streptosporangiaceae bacterium]
MRQVVGGGAGQHGPDQVAIRKADHQTAVQDEHAPARLGLQFPPLVLGGEQERHVLRALVVGGAEDARLAARPRAVMAGCELFEPDDGGAAAGQLPAGHAAHRANSDDRDVGVHDRSFPWVQYG